MLRRLLVAALTLTLVLPGALLARESGTQMAAATPAAAASPSARQTSAPAQEPRSVRPQSPAQRRSYAREVRGRRRSGISKKEVAMLAAIAGTSMGIGALAGGAKGLAIGAIVGGWGAYVGHRLWKWMR